MSSLTQLVPSLAGMSVADLVQAVLVASARGVKVYCTHGVLEKLKPLLDKLGIQAREVDRLPADGTYILFRSAGGIKVKVEIYENGVLKHSFNTTLTTLEKALQKLIEKRRGGAEPVRYYELVVPEDLAEELAAGLEGEDSGKP